MNEETQAINALLEDLTVQMDPETLNKYCDGFKQVLQEYARTLLMNEAFRESRDAEEEIYSRVLQGIVALGLISMNRIEWDQIKRRGLKVVN